LLDYLNCFDRVSSFYQHKPELESILRLVRSLDYPAGSPGSRHNSSAAKRLDRLWPCDWDKSRSFGERRCGHCIGPASRTFWRASLCLHKAIAAVRIARDLTEQGIDAVPVF
jgi:hypothetical protein